MASLDSKGRLTVPSEVRKKYDLERGDTFRISLESIEVEEVEVAGVEEAQEVLQELEDVEWFFYRDGVLEVVLDD
ncbi:MAG: AbrB/MazE/SpoVT family DNA-binding domain-containing protein [Candidatus Nanohaloarchaea archaeon]|nr:AbrB/MazE/SpoVT family DNA-binding domain-containing protein [Candidatus Nanohaloarchaea archaeon]